MIFKAFRFKDRAFLAVPTGAGGTIGVHIVDSEGNNYGSWSCTDSFKKFARKNPRFLESIGKARLHVQSCDERKEDEMGRPRTRCACGKPMSRHSTVCNACYELKMRRIRFERARAVVATRKCPECGTELVRNSALPGWWQCGAYACEAMRKEKFRGLPSCSFQTFTE